MKPENAAVLADMKENLKPVLATLKQAEVISADLPEMASCHCSPSLSTRCEQPGGRDPVKALGEPLGQSTRDEIFKTGYYCHDNAKLADLTARSPDQTRIRWAGEDFAYLLGCAPPVRATNLPIPTWVSNTQARNWDAFSAGVVANRSHNARTSGSVGAMAGNCRGHPDPSNKLRIAESFRKK